MSGGGRRGCSSSHYSCKQQFAIKFFQCWGVVQHSPNIQFKWILCTQNLRIQGGHLWKQVRFALRQFWLWRIFWWIYGSGLVWNLFKTENEKAQQNRRLHFYGKPAFDFHSTSELLHLKMKNTQRLIFTILPTTPILVLDLFFVHFLLVLLSGLKITTKRGTCLHILPWSSTIWRLKRKFLSIPLDIANSTKGTCLTLLHFVGLLLQWSHILHSLDRTLNFHSGINTFISEKLEYSELVSNL